MIANEETQHR